MLKQALLWEKRRRESESERPRTDCESGYGAWTDFHSGQAECVRIVLAKTAVYRLVKFLKSSTFRPKYKTLEGQPLYVVYVKSR